MQLLHQLVESFMLRKLYMRHKEVPLLLQPAGLIAHVSFKGRCCGLFCFPASFSECCEQDLTVRTLS